MLPAFSGLTSICCLCVTVFIWVSSGYSKLLSSNSLSRCVTICSYVPFSKWAWFFVFFRCGGILAYMNWSMIAWAATLNASFASFWSSSKKSTSGSLDWKLVVEIYVLPYPLTGVSRIFYGTQLEFLSDSLGSGCRCFSTSAAHHHAWESGNSLFCLLLWADCGFLNSFGIDLQTVQTSLISHRRWALLSWGI